MYPRGIEDLVDLGDRLNTEMVYPPTDIHTVTGLFVPKTFRSQERNTNFGRFVQSILGTKCLGNEKSINSFTHPSTNLAVHGWELNSQPVRHKYDALTTTVRHTVCYQAISVWSQRVHAASVIRSPPCDAHCQRSCDACFTF